MGKGSFGHWEKKPDINVGVWFQSACSGGWYQNHKAAGAIVQVRIDGESFYSDKDVDDYRRDEKKDAVVAKKKLPVLFRKDWPC